ncbi:MAG: MFS transporter [Henriciella sp.]|nr:MFS transporter [Henriciella sp.]
MTTDAITEDEKSGFSLGPWGMVALGFVCLAFCFAASVSVLPLLYSPVIEEFGWSRTQATVVFTYGAFGSMALSFFAVGPLIDRFGAKPVLIGAIIATSAMMTGFLLIDSLPTYYFFGMLNNAFATVILLSLKVLISRWFNKNQGLAVGVMIAGTSVGGALLPLIAYPLIDALGWRAAYASLSLSGWLIALPLVIFLGREHPTERELAAQLGTSKTDPGLIEKLKTADIPVTYTSLLSSRIFWIIMISLFLAAVIDMGLLQHTGLYLERDKGLGTAGAALGVSGTFALSIGAKIGAGWLYDRISLKGISLTYLFIGLTALFALTIDGTIMLILFIVLRGIGHGGIIADSPILAKHTWGAKPMNRVLPLLTGTTTAGFAIGPLVLAAIYDQFGSYEYGFYLFAALGVLAAAMLWPVRPMYRDRVKEIEKEAAALKV